MEQKAPQARPPIAIVGGGLSGMACALALGADFTLLEAGERLGGLARTDTTPEGFSFDWTGHWLHARDPAVRADLQRWLSGNLLQVERRARIHLAGRWTDFPFQFHLRGLPPRTIARCAAGLLASRARPRTPAPDAAARCRQEFGRGIEEAFLRPYNEKLFRVPLEELSPAWAGRFLPRPSVLQVLRGAFGRGARGGYNARFWYPQRGGIEALACAMARELRAQAGEVRLGARVASIDLRARELRLEGGARVPYSSLVLTCPLDVAAAALVDPPPEVRAAASQLRKVGVTVVEVGVRGISGERFHWAYFPEPRFGFYRVGSPSEVNPLLAPPGCRSFSVEFSHQGDAPDRQALEREAVKGLAACGLLAEDQLMLLRSRTLPSAYALFDHAREAAVESLQAHFRRHGALLAGRYGLWDYGSMEDAILSGRAAAREALALRDGPP